MEDLGGARVQTEISGNAQFFASSEIECFEQIKKLITYIPWNNAKRPDRMQAKPPKYIYNVEEIIPSDPRKPYDIRDVIKALCDDSDFFEVHKFWATNIVVGFARLDGETVGVVGNQPMVL